MKNLVLLVGLSLLFHITIFSQPCLPNGIVFSTQSQIDNFQTNYPNCTEIQGDVEIISVSDITNLTGLNVLTSIGGSLDIHYNSVLKSLAGLDNLTNIGGYLNIEYNDSLESLASLNNVNYSLVSITIR